MHKKKEVSVPTKTSMIGSLEKDAERVGTVGYMLLADKVIDNLMLSMVVGGGLTTLYLRGYTTMSALIGNTIGAGALTTFSSVVGHKTLMQMDPMASNQNKYLTSFAAAGIVNTALNVAVQYTSGGRISVMDAAAFFAIGGASSIIPNLITNSL